MGSIQFLFELHNAHEPTGTFNVQRSTLNVQPSTSRFMGSPLGLASRHDALEPGGRPKGVQSSKFKAPSGGNGGGMYMVHGR
jgi:hypothetical protein